MSEYPDLTVRIFYPLCGALKAGELNTWQAAN
jgi:hypothetical protein